MSNNLHKAVDILEEECKLSENIEMILRTKLIAKRKECDFNTDTYNDIRIIRDSTVTTMYQLDDRTKNVFSHLLLMIDKLSQEIQILQQPRDPDE